MKLNRKTDIFTYLFIRARVINKHSCSPESGSKWPRTEEIMHAKS